MIPRIIHQIYEDPAGPPDMLLSLAATWKEHHPGWEYRFWDRLSIDTFLTLHFPDYIARYRSFPYDVQRWDAIRYLILYRLGGLYADMDYECLDPLDSLLNGHSCCMGLEPSEHAPQFNLTYIIGNALMATVPSHPYFEMIIQDIFIRQTIPLSGSKSFHVINTTGPLMTTRVYDACPQKDEIKLLAPELVAPLSIEEVGAFIEGRETPEMEEKAKKAFAVHYFFGSWYPQLNR